jgi:hypothetical protein
LPHCESLSDFLTALFQAGVNRIYGGPVFVDAPA